MPADQKLFVLFFKSCQGEINKQMVYCRDVSIAVLAKNLMEAAEKLDVKIIGDPVGRTEVKLPLDPPLWFRRGMAMAARKKLWQTRWFYLNTVWHIEQLPMFYE